MMMRWKAKSSTSRLVGFLFPKETPTKKTSMKIKSGVNLTLFLINMQFGDSGVT